MTLAKVISALVFLSVSFAADGQALKQRKPGLWELQYTGEESGKRAEQETMAERLKNMPPEKRAQMEAYLQQHGMGMSVGPGGAPMMTMRFCLTPQDISQESSANLLNGLRERDCNTKVLAQTPSEVHVHAVCADSGQRTSEIDARIYDVSAERYAVDMTARGPRGERRMQQKARWLGSDCKGAF
jgi:uncharacterized protein DUF3617